MLERALLEEARLVDYKGQYTGVTLSARLIEQQNVGLEQVKILVDLHLIKDMIYRDIEATDDKEELWNLGMALEGVEYGMQEAWGFPQSHTYHTHGLKASKCLCPKLDNYENLGYRRIVAGSCPLHFNAQYYAEMQQGKDNE